ncbi:pyridoxamine 5'-phosphate oxidase family protein [Kribbella deserti]|uniref:Pyridoxamine 5'-phosphate oxidase family protein n=1 Tax=Kribbella deserti TaxID=1926257 RepID=A0ABV6QFR3_9ACTN
MTPPPRDLKQRVQDTLERLQQEVDAWVATASAGDDVPYLTPLSYLWEDGTLLLSTAGSTPAGRNLLANGKVRLAIGQTRDVVLVHGSTEAIPAAELDAATGDAFAARTGFDPRTLSTPYFYFRVRPDRILAWREENELAGRVVFRDGAWLAA